MDAQSSTYSVGQVATVSGVSTRTLRYYDSIGLLVPGFRTRAGYRRYTLADCERLRNILLLREMGVPLAEIGPALSDTQDEHGGLAFLERHVDELRTRHHALENVISNVERAIAALQKGEPMSADEMFNGFEHNPHEDEARERWGNTDAYRESTRRAARYTADDWARYQDAQSANYTRFVDLMATGAAPDSAEATAAAEEHRMLFDEWFYPCPHEMHRNIAQMWLVDRRFADNINKFGEGLAEYMCAAITANAEQAEG